MNNRKLWIVLLNVLVLSASLHLVAPTGVVQASDLGGSVGLLNNDSGPLTGSLDGLGVTFGAAFDFYDRSVGVDLGSVKTFDQIKLFDSDAVNRINSRHQLSVYVSDDNLTYQPVDGWRMTKYAGTITLYNFEAVGRYVKVRGSFADTGSFHTYLAQGNLQNMMKVYDLGIGAAVIDEEDPDKLDGAVGFLNDDDTPASGSLADFGYPLGAAFDYYTRSVGVDLGDLQAIDQIRLFDKDTTNRISSASDLSVYVSDDNATYTELTGWTFGKSGNAITIDDFLTAARYVKVRSNFTDAGTFPTYLSQDNLQNMIAVYYTDSFVGPLPGSAGTLAQDVNPAAGSIAGFGSSAAVSLDHDLMSIGYDLGTALEFNSVELKEDSVSSRVEQTDLSLYVSNDNITYTKVEDWDFLKTGSKVAMYNFLEEARYIKIHNHYEDGNPTFSNDNLQEMITVRYNPAKRWSLGNQGVWLYKKAIEISNPQAEVLFDRAAYISKLSLDTGTLISEGKLQADYRDVRFADHNDRELPFYMVDDGFHVRLPEMAGSAEATIYMYYGNPYATFAGSKEALQVEYGNKTIQSVLVENSNFGANIKPIRLTSGVLMLVSQSSGEMGVQARYSFDNGRTWGEPEELIAPFNSGVTYEGPGGLYVNPSTGQVTMVLVSYEKYDTVGCLSSDNCVCDLYVAHSTGFVDGKPVFGTPFKIEGMETANEDPITYAITNSNPIKLTDGTFVVPFAYVYTNDGAFAVSVVYSSDGLTWTKSESQLTLPMGGAEAGLTETSIIELDDDSLKMYIRQQLPHKFYFAESTSDDGGVTWTAPVDSPILATNTLSAMYEHDSGDKLLLWSGHNAFSQVAYYRNNLTLAYSDNNALSWKGYRDVLGRTSLSNPGWYNDYTEKNWVVQPDMVSLEDDSYLFSWIYPADTVDTPYAMIIEDFDRYLTRSTGAVSDFEFENSAVAPDRGTRASQDYWWQSSKSGALETSLNEARHGIRSLRLHDIDSTGYKPTVGSRLFPATRQGSVRFALRPANLANGFHISLQEGFSDDWNAIGSAFNLHIEPDGTLTYSDHAGRSGANFNDANPATGNLDFPVLGQMAFDYTNRSIGVDLGTSQTVTSIVLHDSDSSNRLTAGDLSVYVSDTNLDDWTLVTGWTFDKTDGKITLGDLDVSARFVKVNQLYDDTAFTFVNYGDRMMEVSTVEQPLAGRKPLPTATSLSLNAWHDFRLDFNLDTNLMDIYVNGSHKGQIRASYPANILTHLQISSGSGTETGTDVYLDDLIIQDLSLDLPAVDSIGSEQEEIQ